jgi:hypothetical protein
MKFLKIKIKIKILGFLGFATEFKGSEIAT